MGPPARREQKRVAGRSHARPRACQWRQLGKKSLVHAEIDNQIALVPNAGVTKLSAHTGQTQRLRTLVPFAPGICP